jgi:DNA-binding NtrC family response regulator
LQIRILVVDDEQDICDMLRMLLTREGYEVTTCTEPTQVMNLLRSSDFHLVILDIAMPEMSGIQVLEQIRNEDSDIAVIMATGTATVDNAVAALKLQVSDYVQKPFKADDFLNAIGNALSKKGLSKDPEAELHRSIGNVIREARRTQDLTLKQLARRTGLSVSLLSQIERAESSASISSLYKIASALRLKMSALFGEA